MILYCYKINWFDDKAYIVPSTSTGMMSCRNQKVIQTTDVDTAPRFFKYDFPKSMVNVTPGTMLYMKKKVDDFGLPSEKIQTVEQDLVVLVKPKYFVGSSAHVWSSHMLENRHRQILLHEIDGHESVEVHTQVKTACVIAADHCHSFIIQAEEGDTAMMGTGESCFRNYEKDKVEFLKRGLEDATLLILCSQISQESTCLLLMT